MKVKVSKLGTGTQSWQLWNETDGAQVGVIDDAAGAGVRTLTATFTTSLPTGVKVLRIRAKSTNANDDPIFLGASLKLL
jgi:hypothetical protein